MSKKNKSSKAKKEQAPVIPDKLPYTKGEKIAEILSVVFCIAASAVQIVLYALGIFGSGAIITGIVALVEGAAFTFGSAYPQYTNLTDGKIRATEKMYRNVRKFSIALKFAISTILLLIAVFAF